MGSRNLTQRIVGAERNRSPRQNQQAKNKLAGGSSTVQLAAERHFSAPVAIQDKRKLAVRKNEKQ